MGCKSHQKGPFLKLKENRRRASDASVPSALEGIHKGRVDPEAMHGVIWLFDQAQAHGLPLKGELSELRGIRF